MSEGSEHPALITTHIGSRGDRAPGLPICYRAAIISRTVDTHVAELRRKLEIDPANPRHILTVRKAGYRFQG